MDISKFVLSGREIGKINGNWASYWKQLSKRIYNLRKKLGITSKNRAKYSGKVSVTADDIAQNHEFGHLLLLISERAWANAMCMREVHSTEKKGITGSARSHIISRLRKSTIYAKNLLKILLDDHVAGVNANDVLEARAYVATLSGAIEFEKHNWKTCITYFSEARIIYNTLSTVTRVDYFKDLLSDPVDPSIRYCAYQLQLPRTLTTNSIAQKYFPRSNTEAISEVEKLDADALNEHPTQSRSEAVESDIVPKTISWRSRTIILEDATIATVLVHVRKAEKKLSETLSTIPVTQSRERASAYDDILRVSQDAVDAAKHAIDELSAEGVIQEDQRMQNLQITRTALSYDMISWRIGRNRVLAGERDGMICGKFTSYRANNKILKFKEGKEGKLHRLRENVVLYDAILQSLDSIKELPGILADTFLLEELNAKYEYFSSLKSLATARSHTLLLSARNALALLSRALEKCDSVYGYFFSVMEQTDESTTKMSVTSSDVGCLKNILDGEVQYHRALVELSNLSRSEEDDSGVSRDIPLVKKLDKFPAGGIDLYNIVVYPPVLESAPVKPLFFDVAWNYLEYPGKVRKGDEANVQGSLRNSAQNSSAKRGWFGLGL